MTTEPAIEVCERFAPFAGLARRLLPHAATSGQNASHDVSHLFRVWALASQIAAVEGGDLEVLAAAVLLHDCVAVPKSSPRRAMASRLAGAAAREILCGLDWEPDRISQVVHAIEAHSFSAGIEPLTIEAMILQDADRLDAIGAIGAARCFLIGGQLDRPLYDPFDPAARHRDPNDSAWTLDHFATKLLRLRGSFRTNEGSRLAEIRHERAARIYEELLDEIG